MIRPYWSPVKRKGVLVVAYGVLALLIIHPQSPVHKRLELAWNDYLMWSVAGSTAGGSVGPRLELWRFGLRVAFEKPLLGFGYEGLMARKSEAIANEGFNKGIERYAGLHNYFLHVFVTYGIFGILQSAILLLIPLRMFLSKLRQKNSQNEALAVMGVLLILTHIEFGMSNALFGLNAVQQVFLFWLVVLMGLLYRPSERQELIVDAH
jgi:O-antigen ligase